MRAVEGFGTKAGVARYGSALRLVALAAIVLLLTQAPVRANAAEAAAALPAGGNPATHPQVVNAPRAPTGQVRSRSPYAAWRARREQAEASDTSGHGHRAQKPAGQARTRRVPK